MLGFTHSNRGPCPLLARLRDRWSKGFPPSLGRSPAHNQGTGQPVSRGCPPSGRPWSGAWQRRAYCPPGSAFVGMGGAGAPRSDEMANRRR